MKIKKICFDINNQSRGSISNVNKLSNDETSSNTSQLSKQINLIESNQSNHENTEIPVIIKMFNQQLTQAAIDLSTSYELRVAFIARVLSYELLLQHELRVTFYMRVTNYCLQRELRVTIYKRIVINCASYKFPFNYGLQFIKR